MAAVSITQVLCCAGVHSPFPSCLLLHLFSTFVSCDSVVPLGLPLSPACPVLLARLGLGSWTAGSHLTSSLRPVEPVPISVGRMFSAAWRADLHTESFPCFPSCHPSSEACGARVPVAGTPEDLSRGSSPEFMRLCPPSLTQRGSGKEAWAWLVSGVSPGRDLRPGLTWLLIMPSRSNLPGQQVLVPPGSPSVQPSHCRADVRTGNNHPSPGAGLTVWFLLCGCLGDGKRRRCSLRWGAERGWGTQSRPSP